MTTKLIAFDIKAALFQRLRVEQSGRERNGASATEAIENRTNMLSIDVFR
jgi:hypothetical protein